MNDFFYLREIFHSSKRKVTNGALWVYKYHRVKADGGAGTGSLAPPLSFVSAFLHISFAVAVVFKCLFLPLNDS